MTTVETTPPPAIFRWDLDKTYLRTEFDKLRDLVRVPFETAADKIDVPGVVELIRSIRTVARARDRDARVFFLSASPPQIAKAILDKFALDGIEIDGIVFKDQLQILMRGRFRGLKEQTGFKLAELLRGRIALPDDSIEYLFGDDWETDSLIYSLYADVVAGRLGTEALNAALDAIRVDREWRERIDALLEQVSRGDVVRRIFINLERRTPPGVFRAFGPRLVPTFNYFQTAACLYEEGVLDVEAVERVGRALIDRDAFSRTMLENSLGDVCRRGHLGGRAHETLVEELRRRRLLPRWRESWRDRWRRWWERQRRPVAPPALPVTARDEPAVPDYVAIITAWRESR